MEQKTKLQIIEETVSYYSQNTARIARNSNEYCVYRNEQGFKCAVGRCMIAPSIDMKGGVRHGITKYNHRKKRNIHLELEKLLRPSYRGNELDFWADLQNLHDRKIYWDHNGLTFSGEIFSEHLKSKWS